MSDVLLKMGILYIYKKKLSTCFFTPFIIYSPFNVFVYVYVSVKVSLFCVKVDMVLKSIIVIILYVSVM